METFSLVSFFSHDDMLCRCWENLFPSKNNSSDGSPPGEIHLNVSVHTSTKLISLCFRTLCQHNIRFQGWTNDSVKALFSCCCGKNNGDNASDQVLQIYQRVHQIETVRSDWLFSNFSHMLGLTFPITTTSILSSDPPCPLPVCSCPLNTTPPMCIQCVSMLPVNSYITVLGFQLIYNIHFILERKCYFSLDAQRTNCFHTVFTQWVVLFFIYN